MIFQAILELLYTLITGFTNLLPTPLSLPDWGFALSNLIGYGLLVFPLDVWTSIIANVVFWTSAQIVWAIVEWCWHKVPGIT